MIYLISNQIYLYDVNEFCVISLEEALNLLEKEDTLGLDTEDEGLDPYTKKMLLLQLGTFDDQFLFDIKSYDCKLPEKLKNFLNYSNKLFVIQNAKFDAKFLFQQGVVLKRVFDTMLAETILTNGLQYNGRDLKSLVDKYFHEYMDKTVRGEIITKGLSTDVLIYGAKDVKYLIPIMNKQLKEADIMDLKNAINLDNSFVIVLAYVEYCGIRLDFNKWSQRASENSATALKLKIKLDNLLWKDKKYKYFSGMQNMFDMSYDCIINWDSPKQVIELFKSYGINVKIYEKGEEKESIDAKVLEPQSNDFEILPIYLEYKAVQKDLSTYGVGWSKFINPITGRIHTTFQQLMNTGRLSCGNKRDGTPNLQNIPSDQFTRSCFIPSDGNIMTAADYKSQEQIILANFSKESNLINFYNKGFNDMKVCPSI